MKTRKTRESLEDVYKLIFLQNENNNLKKNDLKLKQNEVENRNYINCLSSYNCGLANTRRNNNHLCTRRKWNYQYGKKSS